jgi:undecaprenyl phosphate-alpha-L-ara4N flippase subunit ArnE
MHLYLYIFLTVCLTVTGQLLLKTGLLRVGSHLAQSPGQVEAWLPVLRSPWIWAGLICWVSSTLFWMVALSRSPLSHIHGLNAVSYLLIPLLAFWCFGEELHPRHWLGFFCITLGVILILNPELLRAGHGSF